jgi:hypothetical protein
VQLLNGKKISMAAADAMRARAAAQREKEDRQVLSYFLVKCVVSDEVRRQ